MNDIDDFLNSIGFQETTAVSPRDTDTTNNDTVITPQTEIQQEVPHPLTENDLEDILAENGFDDTSLYSEAEEVAIEDAESSEQLPEAIVTTVAEPEEIPTEENELGNSNSNDMALNGEGELVVNTPAETPLLKPNSPTLVVDDSTSRFSGAEWYTAIKQKDIIIAGQGGIGSNLAFQIARMSPRTMFLYDDDIVEMANMSGQLFSRSDVGRYKTDAMWNFIHQYASAGTVHAINTRFAENTEAGDIMMCGFDSMAARKTFFNSWLSHVRAHTHKSECLYIDGRLSIDTLQVFCIAGNDDVSISRYMNEYLFNDSEADATVCSMKQTTYLACMIGSVITNLFVNWVANSLDPVVPYDLPFFTEYDSQNMIFKTES